jgi:hypothetical protein
MWNPFCDLAVAKKPGKGEANDVKKRPLLRV